VDFVDPVRIDKDEIDALEVSLREYRQWHLWVPIVPMLVFAFVLHFAWSQQVHNSPMIMAMRCPMTAIPSAQCRDLVPEPWPESLRPLFTEALQTGNIGQGRDWNQVAGVEQKAKQWVDSVFGPEAWSHLKTHDNYDGHALKIMSPRAMDSDVAASEADRRVALYAQAFVNRVDLALGPNHEASRNAIRESDRGWAAALGLGWFAAMPVTGLYALIVVMAPRRRQVITVTADAVRIDALIIEAADLDGWSLDGRQLLFKTANVPVRTIPLDAPKAALLALDPALKKAWREDQEERFAERAERKKAAQQLGSLLDQI